MKRRIVRTTVAITAVAVIVLTIPLAIAVSSVYRDETVRQLVNDAASAATTVPGPTLGPGDPVELPPGHDGTVIGVYAPGGARVAGDGPLAADAVTREALAGHVASSSTGGEVIAAVPVGAQEQLVGAVRAAQPQSAVDGRVHGTWLAMAAFGIAAVAVAGALAVWQARRLSKPLDALAGGAQRLGDGDFSARVAPSGVAEIDTVAGAMNATATRLGTVLDRERAFSADASHQLRTPLTALRIRLEAALLAGSNEREAIATSLQEIDRLERTVDDLVRLARDDPGDRQPLDIAELLDHVEGGWRARLAAAGRPLHLESSPALHRVPVSAAAVRQIVDVLVDNAIVHGRGAVRVTAANLAGGVAIEVTDAGDGITGDPERIFERRRSGRGGTGIGLALARSLAEAEGGRLILMRTEGKAVFRLVLADSRAAPEDSG